MELFNILIDDYIGAGGITANGLRPLINEAKAKGVKIFQIIVNSPGGDVFEGYSIYNMFDGLKKSGFEIRVFVNGQCSSIATLIAMSASPGKLNTSKVSEWMIHEPMGGAEGKAQDLLDNATALTHIKEVMAACYAERMGKDIAEGLALMSKNDNYLKPEEVKALGLIDNIQTPIYAQSKKQFNMSNKKTFMDGINNAFKAVADAVGAAISGDAPTAGSISLNDGSTVLYFSGDEIAEGTVMYTDEAMTVLAAEGDHMLSDGRMITLDAEAKVVRILDEEPADENAEALATAQARILELEGVVAERDTEITAMKAKHLSDINAINTTVTALKGQIFSADGKLKPQIQVPAAKKDEVPSSSLDQQASDLARKLGIPTN